MRLWTRDVEMLLWRQQLWSRIVEMRLPIQVEPVVDPGGMWYVVWKGEMIVEIWLWRQKLRVRIAEMLRDMKLWR